MKLSICMMVKNEGKYLEECLKSLQPLRDAVESELIVVDTGSDDDSVEIAKRFTERVYFHEWANDFSAMRNTTIGYAKGKWVLIIDGDEVLQESQPLIDFLCNKDNKKYGAVAITCRNITHLEDMIYSTLVGFRLFKKDGYFCYGGAVHNQPKFKGATLALPQVYLWHYGYLSNDAELMERKFKRTSLILLQELDKDPTNIYYWTQLSVTYAMHNEYDKAIKAVETAYSLLPEIRTANLMFVFLQMILVYQQQNMPEKVIETCREAIEIKEGYLDVYYYYGEAQAVLKNYEEAVVYYEKYLRQLENYDRQDECDVTIVEYTRGNYDVVYYNLSQMLKSLQEYDRAIEYGEKIRMPKLIKDNMLNLIELYIYRDRYTMLRTYYDGPLCDDFKNLYCEILAQKMETRGAVVKREISKQFAGVDNQFGLMCKMIMEAETTGLISAETLKAAEAIELKELQQWCSGIMYYLLKYDGSMLTVAQNFQEILLSQIFEQISKQYADFYEVLDAYLSRQTSALQDKIKLRKTLARISLLTRRQADERYQELFQQYLEDGWRYMETIYRQDVLDNEWVYDLKNDEEVFLLYMRKATQHQGHDAAGYAKYLRLALQAFAAMRLGVEWKLKEFLGGQDREQAEFETYKKEIKGRIKCLIDSGEMAEAQQLLNEYQSIVPSDLEAVLLQSQVLLN